jgi:hypothetical protein
MARLCGRPERAVNPVANRERDRHGIAMTEKERQRDERLAAALRENLKRRKAQARKLGSEAKDEGDSNA